MFGDQPSRGEIVRAKVHAVGGARPRCQKGKPCSAACIDPTEACLVEFPTPVAESLGSARDRIESAPADLESAISKMDKVRDNYKDSLEYFIADGMRKNSESTYNRGRDTALEFNKMLADKGLSGKIEPMKVPVRWEVYQDVSSRYDRIEKKLRARMQKANENNDRVEYDKAEDRLKELYDKLGSKLKKEIVVKRGGLETKRGYTYSTFT